MGLTVTGKEHVTVTFDQMRSKLFNLDQIRERLGKTEPMKGVAFTVGNAVRFRAEPGWNHGIKAIDGTDTIPVFVALGRGRYTTEYRLTKNCLQETCMAFGFKREYTESCPAELLIPHMNYWFREGLYGKGRKKTDFQFLTNSDTATAFTRQSLTPFSNLSLLEQALAGIEAKFGTGTEVLADYKFSHTLRQTSLRLIVPEANATLHGTGTDNDTWSMGVQIRNSLTGASQTSLEGYLFRWVCTNGQIDTRASSGVWTRRPTATEDEVYAWARQAVDEALSGLDGAFDAVQSLTGLHIEGSLADTLRDVFEHYRIPITQRAKIIKLIEEHPGEVTMYVIMNAITQVANETGLEASTVDSLMRVGGDLPYTGNQRCGACRRIMPH
jgi:hypothetical protein